MIACSVGEFLELCKTDEHLKGRFGSYCEPVTLITTHGPVQIIAYGVMEWFGHWSILTPDGVIFQYMRDEIISAPMELN